jgi:tRNA dimethylallyltransferase
MGKKTVIIIVGPTAAGKTNFAIDVARHFDTSIISADSRQCFIELNIGVAKPTHTQLAEVKHYFINSHHVQDDVNAALFEKLSLEWTNEIFSSNDTAVMVGGTGLYIKAFISGLDEVPPSSTEVRNQIILAYESNGKEWLQQQLSQSDLEYFENGEMQNPQRMMRALEVFTISGRSILSFRLGKRKERPFRILQVGLDLPRAILYERINQRADEMFQAGLIEEARNLFPFRNLNALQTVGYKELFDHFSGKMSLEESIVLIKQNTRHYAKRQLTWFKKDASIHWLNAAESPARVDFVDNLLTGMVD